MKQLAIDVSGLALGCAIGAYLVNDWHAGVFGFFLSVIVWAVVRQVVARD